MLIGILIIMYKKFCGIKDTNCNKSNKKIILMSIEFILYYINYIYSSETFII